MPTLMPCDTAQALGSNAAKCESRSLLLDRFCDPAAEKEERKRVFTRAFDKSAHRAKVTAWGVWLRSLSDAQPTSGILHAQLQARLMINMAGGVMENAGLCLDRFGLPYIPGSAVKSCAHRAALAALREWCEAGGKPEHKPSGADNLFTTACAPFATPAEMLATIARVFGWCEHDWSDRPNHPSGFAWSCASHHREIWQSAAQTLAALFRWPIEDRHRDTPSESLPNFAGSVSFLPAYPLDLGKTGKVEGLPLPVPDLGRLELDVVTCHHRNYYNEPVEPKDAPHNHPRWQRWKQEHDQWERDWGTAPDTGEPVPVVFPAVAPGHVFTFALVKLRHCPDTDLQHARTWLATGLQTFGLGAKTNAGYGWFDCSAAFQSSVTRLMSEKAEREKKAAEEKAAREKAEAEAKARAAEKAAREAALAGLSPDERADKEIELLTAAQFENKVRAFHKEPRRGGPTEEQKKAIVRALRGPRQDFWQQFKAKATKGDLANAANAIRQLCKEMNLGRMP